MKSAISLALLIASIPPVTAQGVMWNGHPNSKAVVDSTLGKSCAVSTKQFPVGKKVWVCYMSGTDGPCQVAIVAAGNKTQGEIGISDKIFKAERNPRYGDPTLWVRLKSFDGDDLWSAGIVKKVDRPLCYVPPCGICGAPGSAGPALESPANPSVVRRAASHVFNRGTVHNALTVAVWAGKTYLGVRVAETKQARELKGVFTNALDRGKR